MHSVTFPNVPSPSVRTISSVAKHSITAVMSAERHNIRKVYDALKPNSITLSWLQTGSKLVADKLVRASSMLVS